MKMLKENATDTTKVEDFFNGPSDQVSHAVVRALDDRDYAEKVRIRDERREIRMKRVAPAEWKAASMLANAYRGKRAREWAAYRKWSLSHEGALMIKYAIILQQKYRCYQARKLLKRKAAERLHRVSHRLLGDANFQKMVFGAVEGTLMVITDKGSFLIKGRGVAVESRSGSGRRGVCVVVEVADVERVSRGRKYAVALRRRIVGCDRGAEEEVASP